jgi:hypothetical protein
MNQSIFTQPLKPTAIESDIKGAMEDTHHKRPESDEEDYP